MERMDQLAPGRTRGGLTFLDTVIAVAVGVFIGVFTAGYGLLVLVGIV